MGTQIVAHTSADACTTFGEHGKVGWYIGPSLEHYRCWKCYSQDTLHERDVLKVDFSLKKFLFPNSLAKTTSNKQQKICCTSYKAMKPLLSTTHLLLVRPFSTPMRKSPTFFVEPFSLLWLHLSQPRQLPLRLVR